MSSIQKMLNHYLIQLKGNNAFREDELRPSISREDALKNAPDSDDKFFKVPKVIG